MLFIQCYLLKNFHQQPLLNDYCEALPPEQRQRASTLQGKRLHEFYFGRQLLKFALNQQTADKSALSLRIIEHLNEAPKVVDDAKNTFASSISHSASWLGVAICVEANTKEIGIDIESIRDGWNIEKVQLFCSKDEIDEGFSIESKTQRNIFFTTLWTQKEAYFKSGGEHVFNKKSSLNNNKMNPDKLLTQRLSDNSIMSIYSHQKTMININYVSIIDNEFIIAK